MDAYLAACQRLGVTVLAGDAVTAVLTAGGSGHRAAHQPARGGRAPSSWTRPAPGSARSATWPEPPVAGRPGAPSAADHRAGAADPGQRADHPDPGSRRLPAARPRRPDAGRLRGQPAARRSAGRSRPRSTPTTCPLDLGVLRAMAGQVADLVPVLRGAGRRAPRRDVHDEPGRPVPRRPGPEIPGFWISAGATGQASRPPRPSARPSRSGSSLARPPDGLEALAPSRFGPLPDDVLVERGTWQYAHYYDPAAAVSGG